MFQNKACDWIYFNYSSWLEFNFFNQTICKTQNQNKCMCVCLQLGKLKHRSNEEFEHFNWLPVTYRSKQFVNYAM